MSHAASRNCIEWIVELLDMQLVLMVIACVSHIDESCC